VEVGKALGTGRSETSATRQADGNHSRQEAEVSLHSSPKARAEAEVRVPLRTPQTELYFSSWVASDPASLHLAQQVERLASTPSPVLITGESGTGKDVLALLIHQLGNTPDAPFVHFDCRTLPPAILERELFGIEQQGSVQRGRAEFAHGGTLALHEVAALPLTAQERLLNVIEESRYVRPGGSRSVSANAKVVAITSVDLQRAVADGTFREELFLCLRLGALHVLPLRERRGDIAPLAIRFVRQFSRIYRRAPRRLTTPVLDVLEQYEFPGNVSELRQIIERAVCAADSEEIEIQHLPAHLRQTQSVFESSLISLAEVERRHIADVLLHTQGRKTTAAAILGISRKTLLEKRKRYGLA